MSEKRRYWRYLLYGLAAMALLSLFKPTGPNLGSRAADLELPLVAAAPGDERTVSLGDPRDKPLLIEVFASWCGTCRRSAPAVARAHETHGSYLDFLGVSVDRDPGAAERVKQDWQIPYPVAHDRTGSFARAYEVSVLPTFILLDQRGHVRKVSSGAPSRGQLARWAKLEPD